MDGDGDALPDKDQKPPGPADTVKVSSTSDSTTSNDPTPQGRRRLKLARGGPKPEPGGAGGGARVSESGKSIAVRVQLLERFNDPPCGLDGIRRNFAISAAPITSGWPRLVEGGVVGDALQQHLLVPHQSNLLSQPPNVEQRAPVHHAAGGAQKQLVAIAQAMSKDPLVLLLDEATTGLDDEDERVVQSALDEVLRKRKPATIVIANHFDDSKRGQGRVGDEGRMVEEGTHDELMALGEARALVPLPTTHSACLSRWVRQMTTCSARSLTFKFNATQAAKKQSSCTLLRSSSFSQG